MPQEGNKRFTVFSVFKVIICSHKMAVSLRISVTIDLRFFLMSMIYTSTTLNGAIQPVLALHT